MARAGHFSPEIFRFLRELAKNNSRGWFQANRERYETALREPCLRFISDLGPLLRGVSRELVADPRPSGGSLFRIYRDTRFSRDKSPYKTHAGMYFPVRGGKDVRPPGFYLHLEPGACFAAAGLWHPDGAALAKVRDAIVASPDNWKRARARLPLEGDRLRRPPRGYDATHPFIEDLKRKDFVSSVRLSDQEVTRPRFVSDFVATCRKMSPLPKFLAEALELPW
ncbi:MAG TPA: DUF2461 domain-containing protein [Thermoanaerobaculia bacterium]|nr:DUF2461 domain-containing protein [Thermoanaerobaculia bacterium]